jgi:hypothetical protein
MSVNCFRLILFVVLGSTCFAQSARAPGQPSRNVLIFVADGLRHASVNPIDTPTLYSLQLRGVSFTNSHSVFPTFTTANASVIATGHFLGDTGDFSNVIFTGYPIFQTGNFSKAAGTTTPFLENDLVLADLDSHFGGNYLNEISLIEAARVAGFSTAAIGKLGPTAIQDISELNPIEGHLKAPETIILDDLTNSPDGDGIPLTTEMTQAVKAAGLPLMTPTRVQPQGNNSVPGTKYPNYGQQIYFAEVTTRVLLPLFKKREKPFVLVYWSRDPDGTQHNQGDSLNSLKPGINGPTVSASLRSVDAALRQILECIENDRDLSRTTDIFVTSDHGFATISKREVDIHGSPTKSYAATKTYKDSSGRQEVNAGFLPPGFLAIDLAHDLQMPLFDPDSQIVAMNGEKMYEPVDPNVEKPTLTVRQRPVVGDGLIGGTGKISSDTDARVVIAANGGSDLVYVPKRDDDLVKQVVKSLLLRDYVGGLFVQDEYGKIPGTLPLSLLGLIGSSKLPIPTIVVSFKTFSMSPKDPLLTAVQIADSGFQEGQGMHGGLGRDNTFNFMTAFGPDFKERFTDRAPTSNADIAPTLAHILGVSIGGNGRLTGRVMEETLRGGPTSVLFKKGVERSQMSDDVQTILEYQKVWEEIYVDRGCLLRGASDAGTCQ